MYLPIKILLTNIFTAFLFYMALCGIGFGAHAADDSEGVD